MAVYVQRGSSFEATAQGFGTGLVGTLGVRIVDNVGGTTLARTTAGITELVAGSGVYAAVLTAPTLIGEYTIIWDDGQTGPAHSAAESLSVLTTTTVQVATGTVGMTFGQILDDVLGNPDRFESDLRARAGRAVNIRYAHLWSLEDWTFRFALDDPNTIAGNPVMTGHAADFGAPMLLWRDDGQLLSYLDTGDFFSAYPNASTVGTPANWTVIAQSVYLGPTPQSSATYRCYYRRRLTALVDEAAYPMIPPDYHLALVHGGRAELLSASDDPVSEMMESEFQQDIDAMRREYLIDAIGQPDYWPSDLTRAF